MAEWVLGKQNPGSKSSPAGTWVTHLLVNSPFVFKTTFSQVTSSMFLQLRVPTYIVYRKMTIDALYY